jgi:hypothetical protein
MVWIPAADDESFFIIMGDEVPSFGGTKNMPDQQTKYWKGAADGSA